MVATNDLETMFCKTNAKLSVIISLLTKFHPPVDDELFDGNDDGFTAISNDFPLFVNRVYTLKELKSGIVYAGRKGQLIEKGNKQWDYLFIPDMDSQFVEWYDYIYHKTPPIRISAYTKHLWVIKEEV